MIIAVKVVKKVHFRAGPSSILYRHSMPLLYRLLVTCWDISSWLRNRARDILMKDFHPSSQYQQLVIVVSIESV